MCSWKPGGSKRILNEIDGSDTEEAIKKFLKKSFFFELNRTHGESFRDSYKSRINSTVENVEFPLRPEEGR